MSRKKNVFQNQKLFAPSVIRRFTNSSGILRDQTLGSMSGSSKVDASATGSFRFDTPGSPLKSSQQLPLDFSKFENHTFFSSAVTNVNLAYEKIINNFPFDGTKDEYETWLDDLTGFEKFVLDSYPSYTGYVTLHGNNEKIKVIDKAGVVFPSISKKNSAETILNPKNDPFFIELDIALPPQSSNKQYIFHHVSPAGVGYAAYLYNSVSTSKVNVGFSVVSGSDNVTTSAEIDKGLFRHLSFYYDTKPDSKTAKILSGTTVIAAAPRFNFGSIDTAGAPLLIGSGSAITLGGSSFIPSNTLSGSINNFRVFHKIRRNAEIERYTKRTFFPSVEDNARLSLRFNEATGSYQNSDVVLDHSGQSLHSKISEYVTSVRSEKPYNSLCKLENSVFHPTLFPSQPDVVSLNQALLTSASSYDENNPNLITNLIPAHYLEIAKLNDLKRMANPDVIYGLEQNSDKYSVPGSADIDQPQIISALLFMWARMFDEIKAMIDHASELVHIDYDSSQGIANQFLPFLSEYYGFSLPNMFRNANYDQFFSGEGVSSDKALSLQSLQNEIWRRILVNLPEIISSKGTMHSIKTLFRSSGIDPDRMFRFAEYGSQKELRLGQSRKKITEISTLLDFSGSVSYNPSSTVDAQGFSSLTPNLISSYLTASRIEVGYPLPQSSSFVSKSLYPPHGISICENDGLLTSGSWTIESRFKFPKKHKYFAPQSLFRVHTTGSATAHNNVILNVVADPNIDGIADDPTVTLYCRPGFGATDPLLSLQIANANIFDGSKWYVSVGRKRNDQINSFVSSSYFMNISRQENGEISEYYTTSSFFLDSNQRGENAFQKKEYSSGLNSSGSFIVVGGQNIAATSTHLNAASVLDVARTSGFAGQTGHLRFWSKALTQNEAKEHAKNFTSLGVEDPLKNFGFSHEVTGSFERLRLDVSTDQPALTADVSGNLSLVDFSQQFKLDGPSGVSRARGFEPSKQIIKPERFDFSAISYLIDEPSSENKVRIAGMTEGVNIATYDTLPAPIYEIPQAAEPNDDVRFAIEFSTAQALNEDIMKLFATMRSLDNAIGSPNAMFSEEYHDLRQLREIYFNRLTGNVNYTSFFEFFRWLDESFDVIVEGLIPKKTNYLGFNMVIEGHTLERSRVPYNTADIYLGENDRRNLKGSIFLKQLLANVRKI